MEGKFFLARVITTTLWAIYHTCRFHASLIGNLKWTRKFKKFITSKILNEFCNIKIRNSKPYPNPS